MNNRKIWFYITLLFFILNGLLAQTIKIHKIELNDSSIYLYFNNLPAEFKSSISDDKQRVNILIPNCEFNDTLRNLPSNQIIKDIFLMHKVDSTEVIINLKEKFGYTAVPLPYSKTILVEFFKWDKLNKSEDLYREALLGIEAGIYDKANENLEKSVEFGNPYASFYLALLNLYDGKLKSAFKNLLFSLNKNIEIPDLYAAMSQILDDFDLKKDAKFYKDIFSQKTGLKDFPRLIIGEIPPGDSLDRETIELLMKINLSHNETYEQLKDSLNITINKIANEDKKDVNANNIVLSLFPEWFLNYFFYILFIIILIILVLFISYQRWKRKQLLLQKEKVIKINRDFEEDLNKAKSSETLKQKATETYKKHEANEIQDMQNETSKEKDKSDIKEQKVNKSKDEKYIKTDDDFQNKIEKLAQQITEIQDKKRIKELDNELPEKEEGVDAKTRLAIHLQEKNFLTKQELISKLNDLRIQDSHSVSKLAQKMKIEKSVIDTKSKIKHLNEDNEKLKELKKKFKQDDNNTNDNT